MKETFAKGISSTQRQRPLLDDGMVALLAWVEEHLNKTPQRIHELCGKREKYNNTVYKCEWPNPKRTLEIHRRKDARGKIILGANYTHPDYNFGRDGIIINKTLIPESIILKLKDHDIVMKATEIIDHPYLTGAWITPAEEREKDVVITLRRGKIRHILTENGVEKLNNS